MLNFRRSQTPPRSRRTAPPNYLGQRVQRRLLLLVLTLGLVIALMFKAADPDTYKRLFPTTDVAAVPATPREIDTRLRPQSEPPLPLDTFIAPAPRSTTPDSTGDYFPGVIPAYLDDVRDNTVMRSAEHDAWFNLLGVLRSAAPDEVSRASTGPVGFVQLFEQPDPYRGKLVTLRGTARRAFDLQAPQNDLGIRQYYQIWLKPADGPSAPIVIYSLELPSGFPTSRTASGAIHELHEDVTVTGFFFKKWAYSTGTQILTAPLVLAKTLVWTPPVIVEKQPIERRSIIAALAGAAAVALAFAVWVYRSSNRLVQPGLSGRAARLHGKSLRTIDDAELAPSIAESLRDLEALDRLDEKETPS